jgi:predicted outer membrane repeat protein
MHKLLRAAAVVAVLGGTATLGLGTQAAMATPTTHNVLCATTGTDGLIYWMDNYTSGDTLSLAPHCTYWVYAQLPPVMQTLTIDGNGATIDAKASGFSIFDVGCATGDLILDNVNVKNGGGEGVDGGAVEVGNADASLTVDGGTFSGNSAVWNETTGGYGGAIYNLGTLTVDGAIFTGNSANWGGAIDSDNTAESATLNDDTFTGNNANEGGAIYNLDNNMQISEGSFRNNTATGEDGEGGAIYNDDTMTVTVTGGHTLFMMNSASYEGGAIYNDGETVNLNNSLVELNRAYEGGGGIYNEGAGVVVLSLDQIMLNRPDNCEPTDTIDGCFG